MRKRVRIRQAVLPMLVSCTLLKFACQAALLPSVLLAAWRLKSYLIKRYIETITTLVIIFAIRNGLNRIFF